MVLFVRLTLLFAACLALLFFVAFVLKLLVAAAFIAALALGGVFLYKLVGVLRRACRPALRR